MDLDGWPSVSSGDSNPQGWLLEEEGAGQRDLFLSGARERLHRRHMQTGEGGGRKTGKETAKVKHFPKSPTSAGMLESSLSPAQISCVTTGTCAVCGQKAPGWGPPHSSISANI